MDSYWGRELVHNLVFDLLENVLSSYYREAGQSYDDISFPPSAEYGQASAIADITTSFTILLAIFFPSVTGKSPCPFKIWQSL